MPIGASTNLGTIFPDPDDLVDLPPEELAGVVLELIPLHQQNRLFTVGNITYPVFGRAPAQYPSHKQSAVTQAVGEAFNWLQSQGFIMKDPGANPSFFVLTRKGAGARSRSDLTAYVQGKVLPKELLPPILAERVWPLFARGDYDVAVLQAFKQVEVAVRAAAGYEPELVGVDLMRKAFHIDTGPLRDAELPKAEREAETHLFAGAIGHAKNPASHRNVEHDPAGAAKLIIFAAYLLGIVERRETASRATASAATAAS
jgi:uncharacterized protein (TIGR02391 family)